ncbi:chemotaxis protein CheX [Candidatus Magnetaquicoccus inordinatus]|uniref:chemotaxis protein CheX n=1 Tax=Candidatus Magnetaquicoccus inordinatus TaxID=2496818 RepID=UPI00102BF5F2|nr:chemotaxis protein CheX [Candidatus Magnetaquicoccus inordinatus]
MKEDLSSVTIKKEFAELIKESVRDVFLTFLSIEITPGPLVMKREDDSYRPPETEVTVIINFSGGIHGGVHLASPLHLALQLAGNFAGEEYDTLFGEAGDGFGELGNMIAGGLQTKLSNRFSAVQLTPPTLIAGKEYRMQYKSNFDSIKQYFKTSSGPFYVEFFFWAGG